MSNPLPYHNIIDAATGEVGNWTKWSDFGWYDAPSPDYWARFELHHRDSSELDQSNAAAIIKALETVDAERDTWSEISANHWAVGWTEGITVQVYVTGPMRESGPTEDDLTGAFRCLWDLSQALADYPVLDDEDLSRREYDGLCEYIDQNMSTEIDREEPHELVYVCRDWNITRDALVTLAHDLNYSRADDVDLAHLTERAIAEGIYFLSTDSIQRLKDDLERVQSIAVDVIRDYLRGIASAEDLRIFADDVETGRILDGVTLH